jgi:alkylation response protein AidB-like acyl-CoA dehydrogenase
MTRPDNGEIEPVEHFSRRAQRWIEEHLPRRVHDSISSERRGGSEDAARSRELQARLANGGFAGLQFPPEYGGQGLTPAHQMAFTRAAEGYELPTSFAVTLGIIAPTLLEHGTEAQRRRHIPGMLRGEELWVQLLSEPAGGSDLAGAISRADRDGDQWILNGAKVWTTGAESADYGLCLARSDWDASKHRGLSMFIVALNAPGVAITPIRQINGNTDFCQEFFDDVLLPEDSLVGDLGRGWDVARTLLVHERNTTGGAGMDGALFGSGVRPDAAFELAANVNGGANDHLRQLAAESYVLDCVQRDLRNRVMVGFRTNQLPGAAGSVLKLFWAVTAVRQAELHLEIAGPAAVAEVGGTASRPAKTGDDYMMSRAVAIGGGTNEIQRNIISERLLDLPREAPSDLDRPFREVPTNRLK